MFDRGFLFGDSVYEVIPFYQGVGFRVDEHIQRLSYSLREVRIDCDLDWYEILQSVVDANGGGNLAVYLQVTRGNPGKRSHAYDTALQPTVFACCSVINNIWQTAPQDISPLTAIVADDIRWQRCDIKANGLLPNILVLQQARDCQADEALLLREQRLTEGSSCNLFIVEQGVLKTPQHNGDILGGTTRELVLQLAAEQGIPTQETDISYPQLLNADEVWVSSSSRGVLPVVKIDGQVIGKGKKGQLWCKIFPYFAEYQRNLMAGLDKTGDSNLSS